MKRLRWFIGLAHTLGIFFFVGLALSMLIVKWTWLDMRTSAGGIILVALLFSGIFYALNSIIKLSSTIPWQKQSSGTILIVGSYLLILASNLFSWESLRILPAAAVRQGLSLAGLSLTQINYSLLFLVVFTYLVHWLVQQNKGLQLNGDEKRGLRS